MSVSWERQDRVCGWMLPLAPATRLLYWTSEALSGTNFEVEFELEVELESVVSLPDTMFVSVPLFPIFDPPVRSITPS